MKTLVAFSLLVLFSSAASAQALAPVTLSPQEFQQVMQALAQRDPVMSFMMQKEAAAQKAAIAEEGAKAGAITPPPGIKK